jgi:hypothetical protein
MIPIALDQQETGNQLREMNDNMRMAESYLNRNPERDLLFGIAMFNDGTYKIGCIENIKDYGFILNDLSHIIEFGYDIRKIYVTRDDTNEKRDYPFNENILRYLTRDVTDIDDENAKKEYLSIIDYAIGLELTRIKNSRTENRKRILNIFRMNRKFVDLIAPKYGIKKLSYEDYHKPGDGLGYKRPIVISSDPSEQYKRLMVLLGTKKSLGEKDNYNIRLEEFTAILHELLRSKQIDKLTYKTFLNKYDKS